MTSIAVAGSALYRRAMDYIDTGEDRERARQLHAVWDPTPWMLEVNEGSDLLESRRREITSWLNRRFGPESSPIHGRPGLWHRGNVTLHGRTWYGFATEEIMREFAVVFCSEAPTPEVAARS